MIRVGIAGIGFMGMVHYLSYQKISGVRVAAVCSDQPAILAGDWRSIKGNFGPAGERMDLSGISKYDQLDDLLADEQLDYIDICLPPALHAEVAISAVQSGKHVFCEKPMAMTLTDCDRMIEAAVSADRRLLIGQVLPYFPEYAWAHRMIENEVYGKLLGGNFCRVISDPTWLSQYWSSTVIGGPMLDLHVHDAHFIRLLFGMPTSVSTIGRVRNGLAEYWTTQFSFRDASYVVNATSGTIGQQGRPFNHGFEIHLEQATLLFEFAVLGDQAEYLCPPTILHADGAVERVKLSGGDPMDAFESELRDVVAVMESGKSPGTLAPQLARDAIEICQMQSADLVRRCSV